MESIQNFLSCFITLYFLTFSSAEANQQPSSGFTLNLIHHDSPLSPFYNSSNTYFDNLYNSFRRAIARTSGFRSQLASFQSPVTAVPGEYLMKISVGTPPVDLLAVADTGSDITWTQCSPCSDCFDQGSHLFNPRKSSTYKNQPCQSNACQSLPSSSCTNANLCEYDVSYGDGSFSHGNLASESFTFGSTSDKSVVLPNITFGCGHNNGGNFKKPTTGIVGLGNGNVSIINQLADTINGKFSYCLVPGSSNVSSKINFGSNAVVSGSGVVSTPFFTKDTNTFYYLNLKSVSIGDTNIKFETTNKHNASTTSSDGNIIIDSGTTITFLPTEFYQKIEDEFKKVISATPTDDPTETFSLCYKNDDSFDNMVPKIRFSFTGADLVLGETNTMVEVSDGVICLSFITAGDDLGAIFGNLQQVNYLVGYDLENKTVSFKPTDCTNQ